MVGVDFYFLTEEPRVCVSCGYEWPRPKTVMDVIDGDLSEISEVDVIRNAKLKDVVKYCKTYEDFQRVGMIRGYKPGWAWYRAKARGLV